MTIATVADAKYVYYPKFYDNLSSWVTQVADTETVFNGTSKIVSTKATYYANNAHREPTEITTTQSDGSTLITKFKRPSDYTVTGNLSFVEKMRSNHILTPVIEQETFLERGTVRKLISGTFISYKQYFSRFFKPDLLYKIETAAPLSDLTESSFISSTGQPAMHASYKPNVYFDAYNQQGNLLSYHESNNISQSYFWGYNSQYPIAKVEGADYNTANQYIITPGILDNPADDQTLRTELNRIRTGLGTNALVTTYTYLPLLGATSVTDPSGKTLYYEYDAFGRLKAAKDKDGKILMVYDYQYQKTVSQ